MNSLQIENIGMCSAKIELIKREYDIFIDITGRKLFDLIVYNRRNNKLYKVEVKTTINLRGGRAHFYFNNKFEFDVVICIYYVPEKETKFWIYPKIKYVELAIPVSKMVHTHKHDKYYNNWSIFDF